MQLQSVIIVNKNSLEKENVKNQFYSDLGKLDFKINKSLELEIDINEKKASIGVEDVKEIISWNSVKTHEVRVAFLFNADKLTTQAQNALLKSIEEPNVLSQIVLITNNKNTFLDTILSRCRVIEFESIQKESKNVAEFLNGSYLEKKKILSDLTASRIEFIVFIENLLINISEVLKVWNSEKNVIELIENWQLALKSNVNIKAIASSVLLNFSN